MQYIDLPKNLAEPRLGTTEVGINQVLLYV